MVLMDCFNLLSFTGFTCFLYSVSFCYFGNSNSLSKHDPNSNLDSSFFPRFTGTEYDVDKSLFSYMGFFSDSFSENTFLVS